MGDDYQRLGLQHDDMNFDDGRREEMDERSRMGIMTRDTSGFVCLFVCLLFYSGDVPPGNTLRPTSTRNGGVSA